MSQPVPECGKPFGWSGAPAWYGRTLIRATEVPATSPARRNSKGTVSSKWTISSLVSPAVSPAGTSGSPAASRATASRAF